MTINLNAVIGLFCLLGLVFACFSHNEMVRVTAYGFLGLVCAIFETRKRA